MLSQFRRALGTRQRQAIVLGAIMIVGLPAPCIGKASQEMSPIARQQIQIALSVRPSFEVRRQQSIAQGQHRFCIWSNGSMLRYYVKLELEHSHTNSIAYQNLRGLDLECQGSASLNQPQSWETAERGSGETGVVTLIISPY